MHPYHHSKAYPDKPACIFAGTGEIVTYKELEDQSNQTAHFLRAQQIRSGDVITLFLHNCPRFFELTWAAQRSGVYYVCASYRLTSPELRHILLDAGSKMLICSSDLRDTAVVAAQGLPVSVYFVDANETCGILETARKEFPVAPIADEEPGQDMLYSSGTTGKPKGVKFARGVGRIDALSPVTLLARDLYGMNSDTIYLSPAPLYHAAPLRFSMAVHQLGGTVVVMERFDPENALSVIEQYGVTHAQWVPTHFVRMLKMPANIREKYSISSLRCAFHAGAPCPIDIKQRMIDWWGPIIHEYYSCTELNGFTAATAQEWLARKGTVGRAIVGKIRICDSEGEPLPPRQEGSIYFENGNPFEYHNDSIKTKAAYNRYGWTTVGDIGWLDEDEYLYLTDRASFMIISGGVNIYPQEVENILITHPKVADAAVIGAPDDDLGERVVAVIEPVDWNDATPGFASELMLFIRSKVNAVKTPRQIDFMRKLPREPTGKLLKRFIRDTYRQQAIEKPSCFDARTGGDR
jgi:long-chain acyl-CoA synthetase